MEKTIIVGLVNRNQNQKKCQEYLDELEFLSYTAGGTVVKRFIQRIENPNPATLIGKGKMDEISTFVKGMDIQTIIFDDELSPAQEKNINQEDVFSAMEQALEKSARVKYGNDLGNGDRVRGGFRWSRFVGGSEVATHNHSTEQFQSKGVSNDGALEYSGFSTKPFIFILFPCIDSTLRTP